ncbi:MAG: radical SAM protein [Phycisphaerae bacterium]|nr:radical SAM protein [Phycisphaerae bacterium]
MTAAAPPLRMLFWESTIRCNLACAHCRRLTTEPSADELTTEEVKVVFQSAARLGPPVVVFSGGEPLLRDDWPELAAYAHTLDLPIALATNGTLIDATLAERIAEAKFRRVSVSLDGADAATHDALRGEGNFTRALNGVEHLHAAGAKVQFNVTVTRANADQLDALATLAREHHAEAMHLFLLVPVGCGAEIAPTRQLPPAEYLRVLEWICDHHTDPGLELRATCGPQVYRVAAKRNLSFGRGRGCLCGQSVAFVSHRGDVFPCGYLPIRCGSVRETNLETIWQTSDVFAALRDPTQLQGACGRCRYVDVCGGCRARAHAATGDYLAEDASCPFLASS